MLIITTALRKHAVATWGMPETASDGDIRRRALAEVSAKTLSHTELIRLANGKGTKAAAAPAKKAPTPAPAGGNPAPTVPPPAPARTGEELFKTASSQIRVKSVAEHFSTATKQAMFPVRTKANGKEDPRGGQPVNVPGLGAFNEPSDLDKAIAGVVVKAAIQNKIGSSERQRWHTWTELDQQLWEYALHEKEWCGVLKPDKDGNGMQVAGKKLEPYQIKTLIADTVSGGLYAVPAAFDDAIVLYPVLYGEIFPFVNLQDVRSNRVQGAAMQRPTFTSGVVEGTGVAPFDTSGFISAFDTAVYNAQGGMEIGKDFEDDSPVAIGDTVIRMFGEAALVWLDRVCAYGNGVSEPQGMLRAAGLANVASSFGVSGPMTVSDFQSLYFAISKAFRNEPGAVLSYVGNDTVYRNGRFIQIGTDDQRRVMGMDWESYVIGEKLKFSVQNDIPDGVLGFFNLKRYRMYRRLGTNITIDDTGYQLRTRNTRLITARMRFGGRLDQAGAGAVGTDFQS